MNRQTTVTISDTTNVRIMVVRLAELPSGIAWISPAGDRSRSTAASRLRSVIVEPVAAFTACQKAGSLQRLIDG